MWREREVYICARCEPISFMLGFGHYHQGQTTHLYCAPYLDLRSAPPFSRKQNKETFTFTFLRERFSLEIYETAQMSSTSLSSLGRFLILNRILIEMMPHLKQILILLYFLQHYGRKRAI